MYLHIYGSSSYSLSLAFLLLAIDSISIFVWTAFPTPPLLLVVSCPMHNPYTMDTSKMEASRITLSPTERAEHLWKHLCFICHKPRCHLLKHGGYPGKERDPQNWCCQNPPPSLRAGAQTQEVGLSPSEDYIRKRGITQGEAMHPLRNYYEESITQEWLTEEESVVQLSIQGFH